MKFANAIFATGAMLLLVGCGGSGSSSSGQGEVSGVVIDETGNTVRDARVYLSSSSGADRSTKSNVWGIYLLQNVPARDVTVRAEVTQNGVRYFGQNLARVSSGERTKSVNVAVFREDQLASIEGEVRDRQGRLVRGVHVFLRPTDESIQSSAMGITDGNGYFKVGALRANMNYKIQANALGYNSDIDTISLLPRENRYLNLVLPDAQITNVPKPTGLAATAFTTPRTNRSDARQSGAFEALKERLNPNRSQAIKRVTGNGNPIEVDLTWDRYTDNSTATALLGFGVYRGSNGSNLRNVDFLRDPLAAFFADLDDSLVEQTSYTYGITALDTLYDGSEGESSVSNTATVTPLGDLTLREVTPTTQPTFRWNAAPGASSYYVYLYDEYPRIGVQERFVNDTGINGTQYSYSGPPLGNGRTFYYIVVGVSADGKAFSLSPVGQFTVNG